MNLSEIVQLTVQQRIILVEAIWESITADRRKTPLTENDIEEMQERIISAQKKPSYMGQWEKIKNIREKKKHK